MREIGGFIEIGESKGTEYHENAIALNCGRSCLEYLIKSKNIKKLYIPYFLCASARNLCKKCGCDFELYSIDSNFKPIMSSPPKSNELVVVINYYGQLNDEYLVTLWNQFGNIVIDNTHAFFRKPLKGIDTFYSCRKFFGVPDGAYLYTNSKYKDQIEIDVSYDRMKFLLGRFELGPQEFYEDYVKNNGRFSKEDMKFMSKLTHNFLKNEDYEYVRIRRTKNFEYLHQRLFDLNKLILNVPDGPFMYPLLVDNGKYVKKKLIESKIFVPTLWPATFDVADENSVEWNFAENIVPLPIDQRYEIDDMKYMLEVLENVLS